MAMNGAPGIFVHGTGAVSPAGWGVEKLCGAWRENHPLPVQELARPGWDSKLKVRHVPPPATRPEFLAHPRLRRSTAVAQYTVAAALEAIGADAAEIRSGQLQLGVVVCVLSGGVTYSRRFYEEVLRDPSTASPLLFPETVFNSPASHLASFINSDALNYTLVGDGGAFLQGLALAADWLADERVNACVVVGAEENDWIVSDALDLFAHETVHAAGAGAIYLKTAASGAAAELGRITDAFSFTGRQNRAEAVRQMRAQLPACAPGGLFSIEQARAIFGEAFTASAAWTCVAACEAVRRGKAPSVVSVPGRHQQAIGAQFVKANDLACARRDKSAACAA